jgi:hypothetical protein
MSSVNGHCHVGGGPVAVALHQAMAGNEIAEEQIQTRRIRSPEIF